MPYDISFDALLDRANADPAVLGVLLSGSRVHEGLATARSDHDLWVVTADGAHSPIRAWHGFRSARLDVVVLSLAEFRLRGLPGDAQSWSRYAFVHARVLTDRLGGGIGRVLDRKRTLTAREASAHAAGHLDAYANQTYRSMKNHRAGRAGLAHLDAAEAVPFLLETLFALHARVRPYNSYLEWELRHHPLGARVWEGERLLPRLRRVVADGDRATQRALFADVERAARAGGHGGVLDAWGADLELMRP
ncbi:hypothetical protein [Streptomyces marincola]|uniref:hypothetical protein n=1 Tax=Streptomyces marincola TaxID=2878388 RepID=UPI001CF23FFC|nr:hypothetical protein [Streptomyces marincola]UCM86970.1 hypothetical protein LC193_02895 [Streptomyces marincola]